MGYYSSAEQMSEALELPLLLRADADPAFLARHDRLSGYAAKPLHSRRLYHRLLGALRGATGRAGLQQSLIWLAGPWGTTEQLPWAVGLAEQASRQDVRAYLLGSQVGALIPTRRGASGEPLPGILTTRGGLHVPRDAQAVATDIEGVRLILPGSAPAGAMRPSSPEKNWVLILVESLPESLEGPFPDPRLYDAVVLVVAFRDHGVREIATSVQAARRAGIPLVGLVGIGPTRPGQVEPAEGPADAAPAGAGRPGDAGPASPPLPVPLDPGRSAGPAGEGPGGAVPSVHGKPGPIVTQTSWASLATDLQTARVGPAEDPAARTDRERPGTGAGGVIDRIRQTGTDGGADRAGRAGADEATATGRESGVEGVADGAREAGTGGVADRGSEAGGEGAPDRAAGDVDSGRPGEAPRPEGERAPAEVPDRLAGTGDRTEAPGPAPADVPAPEPTSAQSPEWSPVVPSPPSAQSPDSSPAAPSPLSAGSPESSPVVPSPPSTRSPESSPAVPSPPSTRPRVSPPSVTPVPSRPPVGSPPIGSPPVGTAPPGLSREPQDSAARAEEPERAPGEEEAVSASRAAGRAPASTGTSGADRAAGSPGGSGPGGDATETPGVRKSLLAETEKATSFPAHGARRGPDRDSMRDSSGEPATATTAIADGSRRAAGEPESRSVSLLTAWERETRRRSRASRVASRVAIVLVILLAIFGVYWGGQRILKVHRGETGPVEPAEPAPDEGALNGGQNPGLAEGVSGGARPAGGSQAGGAPGSPGGPGDARSLRELWSGESPQSTSSQGWASDSLEEQALAMPPEEPKPFPPLLEPQVEEGLIGPGAESSAEPKNGERGRPPEETSAWNARVPEERSARPDLDLGFEGSRASPGGSRATSSGATSPSSTGPGATGPRPTTYGAPAPGATAFGATGPGSAASGAWSGGHGVEPAPGSPATSVPPSSTAGSAPAAPAEGGASPSSPALTGPRDEAAGGGAPMEWISPGLELGWSPGGEATRHAASPGSAIPVRADSSAVGAGAAPTERVVPSSSEPAVPTPMQRIAATPGWRDTFVVHLSSFGRHKDAEAEVARLRSRGIDASYVTVQIPGKGRWYRVFTGRFPTFAEAESLAYHLRETRGFGLMHVVPQSGRGQPVPVPEAQPETRRPGRSN